MSSVLLCESAYLGKFMPHNFAQEIACGLAGMQACPSHRAALGTCPCKAQLWSVQCSCHSSA